MSRLALALLTVGIAALLAAPAACAADPGGTPGPWSEMDYGPALHLTLESPWPERTLTQKGIAIRLPAVQPEGAASAGTPYVLFDIDTLRYAAGWTAASPSAFIDWRGVLFNGAHRVWATLVGDQAFGTRLMPGWANPASPATPAAFDDPRPRFKSVDYKPQPEHWQNRAFGPLPRAWGRYRGLYLNGPRTILAYTVGTAEVLESPAWEPLDSGGKAGAFARTLNVGKSDADLTLLVLEDPRPGDGVRALDSATAAPPAAPLTRGPAADTFVAFGQPKPKAVPAAAPVPVAGDEPASLTRGLVARWTLDEPAGDTAAAAPDAQFSAKLSGGKRVAGPRGGAIALASGQHAIAASADGTDFSAGYSVAAWVKTAAGGTILSKAPAGKWVPGGKTLFVERGVLTFDIGWVGAVRAKKPVADDRWHHVALTYAKDGAVRLYVDGRPDGKGALAPRADPKESAIRLGLTSADFPRGNGNAMNGALDDVRLFNRVLDPAEVAALAGASSPPPEEPAERAPLAVFAVGAPKGVQWDLAAGGQLRLTIPAAATPAKVKLLIAPAPPAGDAWATLAAAAKSSPAPEDLAPLTRGGPARYPQALTTAGGPARLKAAAVGASGRVEEGGAKGVRRGAGTAPAAEPAAGNVFAADAITHPADNPWKSRLRFGGFDFFPDGKSAAICTWDGDVWIVSGIDESLKTLTWRRFATGLYQPLGLKIIPAPAALPGAAPGAAADRPLIYVCCRDQIVRLRDLNGDGEADFYECFNTDHQVSEHFHEFATGLDTDAEGNLYYAKAARHALPAVVAQHGTVIRVSKDGLRSEILCTGLRAANGLSVGPNGPNGAPMVVVSDQEGYWMPANRINLLLPPKPFAPARGGRLPFYGNVFGYTDPPRTAAQGYDPPLVWMPPPVDRSPAEEFWCTSDAWAPLKGSMLHVSYGTGKVYLIPYEIVDGVPQGGIVPLPGLAFPTGIMRGRFNPADGQLYVCGLFGWSSNCSEPGGFYRIRYTGKPMHLPVGLKVRKDGVAVTFTDKLDKATAEDTGSYAVERWGYRWTQNYGSKDYSVEEPAKQGHDDVDVAAATLEADGRTVFLKIDDLKPVMQMRIEFNLKGADGTPIKHVLHETINKVPG